MAGLHLMQTGRMIWSGGDGVGGDRPDQNQITNPKSLFPSFSDLQFWSNGQNILQIGV